MTRVLVPELVHPEQPKSTARRGTRRVHPNIRARMMPTLGIEAAKLTLATPERRAELAPTASRTWLVNRRALAQSSIESGIPDARGALGPVRRIGTYKGAGNRIGMYVVEREGTRVHLCAESRLETNVFRDVDRDPRTRWMHAQPFLLMWQVGDACIWRVPDLVVRRDSSVVVIDVKPRARVAENPYFALVTHLTGLAMRYAGWGYEVHGSMSEQRAQNLRQVGRHRWVTPALVERAERGLLARPRTLGRLWTLMGADDEALMACMHLIGSGRVGVDLDQPITLSSVLEWPGDRPAGPDGRSLLDSAGPWFVGAVAEPQHQRDPAATQLPLEGSWRADSNH